MKTNEVVQKLSPAAMGWDKAKIYQATQAAPEVFLCRMMGKINGLTSYVDAKSSEVRFGLKGDFLGINSDGVEFVSGVAYLPSGIQAQLETKAEELKDGENLEFAIDIYGIRANNAAGYSFKGKTYAAEATDAFSHLRKAAADMPAIGGPAPVATIEAPKAEPEAPAKK